MAMKKKPNAAGVLTAGKKGNTKNTKVKAKPNAGLLAGYRRLEAACASLDKKMQKAFSDVGKQGIPPTRLWRKWEEDEELRELVNTFAKLKRAKELCDSVFELVYNSVREFCE